MARQEVSRALVVAPSEALRILIADALRRTVASGGSTVEVTEVADGFLALARIGREPFDVVIASLDLPALPADEFVRYLRARPDQTALPIVAVGADAAEWEPLLSGAAALATSPFTAGSLRSALERAGFRFGEDG